MTENIFIRYATPLDNALLAELGAETFYDSFAADNTPDNMTAYLAGAFSQEKQAQELADPASRFLIAENDKTVVGYARLNFGPAPDAIRGNKGMEIARLYARKPWIGKGVGALLMKVCLREAAQAGCDVVWLGVWERNLQAIDFYRKWGFMEVGRQMFQLGDDAQQDWIMTMPV
jgi:diamine N-acetyltransferase